MQSRFYDLAKAVLDAVVAGWPADPLDAAPLPKQRYVAFGTVAWDCEQFTVSGVRSFSIEADIAQEGIVSNLMFPSRGVELELQIVRCVPTADSSGEDVVLPTPAAIEQSAVIALTDEQVLRDVLIDAQQAGTLATPSGLAFGNWQAVGPAGGFGAGGLRVRLAGY